MMVGILGPSNLELLRHCTGRPVDYFIRQSDLAGQILARQGFEVVVTADKGIPLHAAYGFRSVRQEDGPKLIMLSPRKQNEWNNPGAKKYERPADVVVPTTDWPETNRQQVRVPQILLVLGLSPGVGLELANANYDLRLAVRDTQLQRIIVVLDFLEGGKFPKYLSWEFGGKKPGMIIEIGTVAVFRK
ncbi:MAG: hypothetical protein HYT50_02250, partial [Candidatus Wildermuthbacteria bacterium]|nr:hypothetical protein [Candidatus Wildermuthbacteria bacterium]